jgi:hypothetical protein
LKEGKGHYCRLEIAAIATFFGDPDVIVVIWTLFLSTLSLEVKTVALKIRFFT